MKYSLIFVSLALGAFALPQDQASVTSPAAPGPSFSPQQECAAKCEVTDVTCKAECFGVARPNESQVVETTQCAAECDQGDGSPEATERYGQCLLDCNAKFFPSSQTLTDPAPASNPAATATPTDGSNPTDGPTGTGAKPTGSSTETGLPAQASGTGAANSVQAKIAGAGLAGLALAIFGL